jgi:UPF0716 family protein affecting phage T7 exclusion
MLFIENLRIKIIVMYFVASILFVIRILKKIGWGSTVFMHFSAHTLA